MKARYFLIAVSMFLLISFSSCYNRYHYNGDDVSVTVNESDDEYKMSASFDEDKTRMVQNYISDRTGNNGIFRSGGNIQMDATTTLDDNIKLHIKFHPGRLKIDFDKTENSPEAYEEVKDICEGIKDLLTKDQN
jgi:hypothetical protein